MEEVAGEVKPSGAVGEANTSQQQDGGDLEGATGSKEVSTDQDEGTPLGKKRGAGADFRGRDDADDEEEGTTSGDPGSFQRADAQTMQRRRILKPVFPGSGGSSSSPVKSVGPNPFSGFSLTASTKTTTSDTAGAPVPATSTTSLGFGAGTSSSSSGGFGFSAYRQNNPFQSALGGPGTAGAAATGSTATAPTNPFAAAAASLEKNPFAVARPEGGQVGFGFGAPAAAKLAGGAGTGAQEGEDDDGVPEDLEAEPAVTFNLPKVEGLKDPSYKPVTGEEEEVCVLQLRGKLFRLTEIKGKEAQEEGGPKQQNGAGSGGSNSAAPAPVRKDWVECGVGMAKVLVGKAPAPEGEGPADVPPSRLVMRREPGTTVILNLRLKPPVGVAKHAEKALRLTFIEGGKPATYLLRFKTNDESEQMLAEVQQRIGSEGSSTTAGNEG